MGQSGPPCTRDRLAQKSFQFAYARRFRPAARVRAFVHGLSELLEQSPLPLGERARERGVEILERRLRRSTSPPEPALHSFVKPKEVGLTRRGSSSRRAAEARAQPGPEDG